MFAGGSLGLGLGIQSSLEYLAKQPGELAQEVSSYQYRISINDFSNLNVES